MMTPHGLHLPVNGIRLHVRRHGGSGPPLVIVPGLSSAAMTWELVAERFAPTRDVHVIDVRGRGLSSNEDDLDYSTDALSRDIVEAMTQMVPDGADLVGHSLGARLATMVADAAPRLVRSIVLVDPVLAGPGRRPFPVPLDAYRGQFDDACAGHDDIERWRASNPRQSLDQLRLRLEWLPSCSWAAMAANYASFGAEDIHGAIARLSMPAMVMRAALDTITSAEEVDDLRALLPSIRVAVFERAGHMIAFDDLDGFQAEIERFLTGA